MLKRTILCIFFAFSFPMALAGYSDGYIIDGEYEGSITWRSYDPPLVVDGGGAVRISVRDSGCLEVRSTSTPLGVGIGGVYDILLYNHSQLLYVDGITELIDVGDNVKAILKGGSINYIRSMKFTNNGTDQNVDLYCLPGWSWISDNSLLGITGQWWDGSSFSIKFINDFDYDPAWTNINIITPEPTTLLLLGLGGLLLRRKRS